MSDVTEQSFKLKVVAGCVGVLQDFQVSCVAACANSVVLCEHKVHIATPGKVVRNAHRVRAMPDRTPNGGTACVTLGVLIQLSVQGPVHLLIVGLA